VDKMANKKSSEVFDYLEKNNLLDTILNITNVTLDKLKSTEFKVGAIDIGYGNTKFTSWIDGDRTLIVSHFPSLTPLAPNVDMSGGSLGKRNTTIVEVNTVRYEIGYDTEMIANGTDTSRVLNESYIFSEPYHALLLGALSYMDKSEYDILVMGLPVKYMHNANKLIEKFQGIHDLNDNKTCNIKKIIVIPQPLGGFYDIAIKENMYEEMVDEVNLVIDPGYLTFDFLLLNGLTPIENRSDALTGGMSRVLTQMAKSISQEIGRSYEDYNNIDKALRILKKIKNPETGIIEEKRVIKVGGKVVDLLPHIRQTTPIIENSITYMHNKLGTYDDIDNIILVGGPENVFEKKIRDHLVDREIKKSKTPIYSNVTGFWFWAIIQTLRGE
jgi:plasmid segregation protein ParM